MLNFRIAVLGAATATAMACVANPALAADDGYENVFSSVLTAVGVLTPDKTPDIDYRERAPLVVPPKMSLEHPLPEGAPARRHGRMTRTSPVGGLLRRAARRDRT